MQFVNGGWRTNWPGKWLVSDRQRSRTEGSKSCGCASPPSEMIFVYSPSSRRWNFCAALLGDYPASLAPRNLIDGSQRRVDDAAPSARCRGSSGPPSDSEPSSPPERSYERRRISCNRPATETAPRLVDVLAALHENLQVEY